MMYLLIFMAVIVFAVIGFRFVLLAIWHSARLFVDAIKCVVLNFFRAVNIFKRK